MFCRQCGNEIPDSSRFCTKCGADQQGTAVSKPVSVNNAKKPDSYMWLSVLVTVLCCMPFGIVGIIYSSKSDTAWAGGDEESARKHASSAKLWSLAGIGLTVLFWLLYVIVWGLILGYSLDFWSSDSSYDFI